MVEGAHAAAVVAQLTLEGVEAQLPHLLATLVHLNPPLVVAQLPVLLAVHPVEVAVHVEGVRWRRVRTCSSGIFIWLWRWWGGCGGGGAGCSSSPISTGCAPAPVASPSAPCAPSGSAQQPCASSYAPTPYSQPASQGATYVQPAQGGGGGNSYAVPQPAPSQAPYNPAPTIQSPYNPPPPPLKCPIPQLQSLNHNILHLTMLIVLVQTLTPTTKRSAEKEKSQILTNKIVKVSTKPSMSTDLYEDKVPDLDEYPDTPSSTTISSSPNIDIKMTTKAPVQPEKDDKLSQDYSENSFLYKNKLSGVPQTDTDGNDNTGDPKCSSETLRIIMQENIVSSPTISKQLIFSAGRLAFGQSIDVKMATLDSDLLIKIAEKLVYSGTNEVFSLKSLLKYGFEFMPINRACKRALCTMVLNYLLVSNAKETELKLSEKYHPFYMKFDEDFTISLPDVSNLSPVNATRVENFKVDYQHDIYDDSESPTTKWL
uniref:Uncharacterized protein n=1 Tax=Ditylenchus dipsaci TaxID=166011 RepID=A0A915E4U1_9BILA